MDKDYAGPATGLTNGGRVEFAMLAPSFIPDKGDRPFREARSLRDGLASDHAGENDKNGDEGDAQLVRGSFHAVKTLH